jgi:hypothetical protein
MNEASFAELSAWLTQAGLDGASEADILRGFCSASAVRILCFRHARVIKIDQLPD